MGLTGRRAMQKQLNDYRQKLRDAKAAGFNALQVLDLVFTRVLEAAKAENWKDSERAMALADEEMSVREVFGKRATDAAVAGHFGYRARSLVTMLDGWRREGAVTINLDALVDHSDVRTIGDEIAFLATLVDSSRPAPYFSTLPPQKFSEAAEAASALTK